MRASIRTLPTTHDPALQFGRKQVPARAWSQWLLESEKGLCWAEGYACVMCEGVHMYAGMQRNSCTCRHVCTSTCVPMYPRAHTCKGMHRCVCAQGHGLQQAGALQALPWVSQLHTPISGDKCVVLVQGAVHQQVNQVSTPEAQP